jgi:Raf kinase inhibitor-like YbhB/YbcL family protein
MIELKSLAFDAGDKIPATYTCEGENVSPPIVWTGGPKGTQSFALVMDDPDAPDPRNPRTRWVHWILFDLPADTRELPEHVQQLPHPIRQGLNDWHQVGYQGPCPPIGRHRYFFKLYALDCASLGLHEPTRQQLEHAMHGHILATAELVGTYQKGD